MNAISFCIITDLRRPEKLAGCVRSIESLGVPRFEVVVAVDSPRRGKLGALRNWACKHAAFGTLVVADDDILFHPNFYTGLCRYGDDFDVLVCKILNPDGTRHWDWATYGGPSGHHLLDYNEEDDGCVYPPGGLIVLKWTINQKVKWSDEIGFQEGAAEDVDYGIRLHRTGYTLKMNPHSTVTHDDDRYTRSGNVVIRR